jgi:hypothetical protein
MKYFGWFALAPLAAQCQPACAPVPTPPAPPPVRAPAETTTTTTTTTAPAGPDWTAEAICMSGWPYVVVHNNSTVRLWADSPAGDTALDPGETRIGFDETPEGEPLNPFPVEFYGPTQRPEDLLAIRQFDNPCPAVSFSVLGYGCDDHSSMSGWVRSLYVHLERSEPVAGLRVSVDGGAARPWEHMALGSEDDIAVTWPSTGTGRDLVFADSFTMTITTEDGETVHSDTFTEQRVAAEEPLCSPMFRPPA